MLPQIQALMKGSGLSWAGNEYTLWDGGGQTASSLWSPKKLCQDSELQKDLYDSVWGCELFSGQLESDRVNGIIKFIIFYSPVSVTKRTGTPFLE